MDDQEEVKQLEILLNKYYEYEFSVLKYLDKLETDSCDINSIFQNGRWFDAALNEFRKKILEIIMEDIQKVFVLRTDKKKLEEYEDE